MTVPSNLPWRPTTLAHEFLKGILQEGDLAIDATAGNGHDSVFLAEAVGLSGRVLAFDIQAEAVAATRRRLELARLATRVEIFQTSHRNLAYYASEKSISAVMFNLGYLPGTAHEIATDRSETLHALVAASSIIKQGGALSVVCYPGHPGGDTEAKAVEKFMLSLAENDHWKLSKYGILATKKSAPFLLFAVRIR